MTDSGAVLFDLDGTLIDSQAHHLASWQEMFGREGHPIPIADILPTFGQTSPQVVRSLLPYALDQERVLALADKKEAIFRDMIRGELELLPGALGLLRALREADYRVALATSAPPENVAMVLQELAIATLFDAVVGEKDITRSKPDPEIFLLAAQRVIVQPRHCLVFEDSPSGVQAAKAAGMKCVAVLTGYSPAQLQSADLQIQDFLEIDLPTIATLIADRPD